MQRCGFVAILGLPNAGKSTLINALVGQKVSIVSPKAQTTRSRVLGILCVEPQTQIIFMDTPGIFAAPKRRLERSMVASAWATPETADLSLVVVDAQRPHLSQTEAILHTLLEKKAPVALVLNKIDCVKREALLALAQHFSAFLVIEKFFMISALKKDHTQDILTFLTSRLPEGPWLYPEDQVSDMPQRLLAAEVTREHLFRCFFDEIPYALYVETETWEPFKNGSLRISQVIYVQRETQRGIILGHKGQNIKRVGERARQELQDLLDCPLIHLFLHVKVKPDWPDHPEPYAILGLDFKS